MQQPLGAFRRSSLLKVGGIGALILVMLIPMSMTRSVIQDRQYMSAEAQQNIMASWGYEQLVGAPILVVPYSIEHVALYGDRYEDTGEVYLLPERFSVDVELKPEIRYRGVHEVAVYMANTVMSGQFGVPDTSGLGIDHASFDWSRAYFALPISDARAIRNSPSIDTLGQSFQFEASGGNVAGLPAQIIANVGDALGESARAEAFDFSLSLDIGGTKTLKFLPLGDTTEVMIESTWPSPAFVGKHLPETREVTANGFQANWRVASLGRALPSRWTTTSLQVNPLLLPEFGVDLFQPIGIYQMTNRATKYAVLFIGLTFVAFFLFEVLAKLRLHPLQYLLVGFANTLFFLLLLSLAEHIGFLAAYALSALASVGLVATFSLSILAGRTRATMVAAMLGALYGFLFLTLQAESYAMLAGAIGLWFSLGLIMYLTRRIDWYSWGTSGKDQEDLFDGKRT